MPCVTLSPTVRSVWQRLWEGVPTVTDPLLRVRLAKLVRQHRLEVEWTQAELAHALRVDIRTVRRYESGRTWPDEANLRRLMLVCDIDPEALFRPRRGAA